MKRVLSGLRSNSEPTLGNYLGAIKPWAAAVKENSDVEYIFFIPNLHSLNNRNAKELRYNTLSNVAWFVAAGIAPHRANITLFAQSQVPVHSEMAWIFNNYTTMGELNRQTQYKEKVQKGSADGQLVSLFAYPTLMAADILLYDADEVPVGEDQRQHVELARDIATRINNHFGQTFRLPKATNPEVGARVMNLQNPGNKMSKSDEDQSGNILLGDSPEEIRQKVKRAVTDSGSEVESGKDKPAITNLLQIYSAITGLKVEDIEREYKESGYKKFKGDLADQVVEHLEPIQNIHNELMLDEDKLLAILESGRVKADEISSKKLREVKEKLGLL